MGSKSYILLGLAFAVAVLLISTEAAARDLAETTSTVSTNDKKEVAANVANGVKDAKYDQGYGYYPPGGGGYPGYPPGGGGYPGYPPGGGGYPGYPPGGGGYPGYPPGGGYPPGCCTAADDQTQTKPQN